jgi:putative FmdB family regulatory protein
MPIYEYECLECGLRFDKLQRFGEPGPETCPRGHERIHRLLSQPAIIFKGSGFYVTDNRRNGSGSRSRRSLRDSASREEGTGHRAEGKEVGSASASQDGQAAS